VVDQNELNQMLSNALKSSLAVMQLQQKAIESLTRAVDVHQALFGLIVQHAGQTEGAEAMRELLTNAAADLAEVEELKRVFGLQAGPESDKA
jgi:hypothetical protein